MRWSERARARTHASTHKPAATITQHRPPQLTGAVEEGAGGEHWRAVTCPHYAAVGHEAAEKGEVGGSGGVRDV